jgi:hypothetical protein
MMVVARSGGPAEPRPVLGEELGAQSLQTQVGHSGDGFRDPPQGIFEQRSSLG